MYRTKLSKDVARCNFYPPISKKGVSQEMR